MAYNVYDMILDAVVAKIRSIYLMGLPPENVKKLSVDRRKLRQEVGLPAVVTYRADGAERHNPTAGTNVHEEVIYSVPIMIVGNVRGDSDLDGSDGEQRQEEFTDVYDLWKDQIIDTLWRDRLVISSSRVSLCDAYVSGRTIMVPAEFRRSNLWVSTTVMDFITWHNRQMPIVVGAGVSAYGPGYSVDYD